MSLLTLDDAVEGESEDHKDAPDSGLGPGRAPLLLLLPDPLLGLLLGPIDGILLGLGLLHGIGGGGGLQQVVNGLLQRRDEEEAGTHDHLPHGCGCGCILGSCTTHWSPRPGGGRCRGRSGAARP